MDSFQLLKRRTTELFQSLPPMPSLPTAVGGLNNNNNNTMKGTWEQIHLPPLPRSGHSANEVAGTVYIFGGDGPRASRTAAAAADNDMHAVALPWGGTPADCYAIKAKAAAAAVPTKQQRAAPPTITVDTEGDGTTPGKELSDVELTSPSAAEPTTIPEDLDGGVSGGGVEDKGKSPDHSPDNSHLPSLPSSRLGHATAVIGHRIFMFGGRDSKKGQPLDEGGRVWVFDTRSRLWSYLDSASAYPLPASRSNHAAVATSKPDVFDDDNDYKYEPPAQKPTTALDTIRDWTLGPEVDTYGTPQNPIVGAVAERATDIDADGYGTLIIHAGLLGDGSRANDTWAFDVRSRTWRQLPDAPGPERDSPCLTLARGGKRIYRFGGYDGTTQLGGQLDYLDLNFDNSNLDKETEWKSIIRGREDVGYKEVDPAPIPSLDADEWPGPRSSAAMQTVTVASREYIVLMLGERRRKSENGGSQLCWDDVWAYKAPGEGISAAGLAGSLWSAVGGGGNGSNGGGNSKGGNGSGGWTRVVAGAYDEEDDAAADGPGGRLGVASATMGDLEESGIVVWGGVGDNGRALGDGWILRVG